MPSATVDRPDVRARRGPDSPADDTHSGTLRTRDMTPTMVSLLVNLERRGVDALIEHHQVRLPALQVLGQVDEVLQGASEAVEFGDHQLIPRPQHPQRLVELGPAGELSGGLVGEDPLAAGRSQGVGLGVGVLVAGGDPRVAIRTPGMYRKPGCA